MAARIAHIPHIDVQEHKMVQERKRHLDQRRKYAHGVLERASGRPNKPVVMTPAAVQASFFRRRHEPAYRGQLATNKRAGKHPHPPPDIDELDIAHDDGLARYPYSGSGASSADEDVDEASAAPAPDAEITYTFDHDRGPAPGDEILSHAVAQAVERFQTKETETLVKREYDVVDASEEGEQSASSRPAALLGDDDFELV